MRRGRLLLAALLLGGCDTDGTVNNDGSPLAATVRVSVAADGTEANNDSRSPSLSADGRRVAFISEATNLHPDDKDAVMDVLVKDLATGEVFLASRADGPDGLKGDEDAFLPRISGDGKRVAFMTEAQLDPVLDTDSFADVYVREVDTGRTWLGSRAANGSKANGQSSSPDLSHDGRWLVFVSNSTNLSPSDPSDNINDVYLRDLETGQVELISVSTGGTKANGVCSEPRVSADGSRVSFLSQATTLVSPPLAVVLAQVYLRDRAGARTLLLSRASGADGAIGTGSTVSPAISADGRFVAFQSSSNNLHPDDSGTPSDIYVRVVDEDVTEVVSRASGAQGPVSGFGCGAGGISGDGRFVSFTTSAANLGIDDENGAGDVYVRDRALGVTFRGSARTFGGEINGNTFLSVLSADGRSLCFETSASNAVDGDGNTATDVFVRSPLR